jgi:hypothetical protein
MSKYFFVFVFLMILVIFPVFADNESAQRISNSSNDSVGSFIAIDGTNVFIAWTDQSRSGPSKILFSKSTDGGQTFSAPQIIGNQQGNSIAPFIATDGTTVFITWTYRVSDNSEIFFSKSTNGGETFSTPQKISSDSSYSSGSRIAIDGKNIFLTWFSITWSDGLYKNMEIHFSKSTDGGETFSEPQNISNNEGFSQYPSIVTDGSNIFVTWSDDSMERSGIFFSKSTDGGQTFSAPQNISNPLGYSSGPFVATDGKNIFVAWFYHVEGKEPDIHFTKSTDGGQTFSAPQNLSNTAGYSGTPFVATDGSNIFLIWIESQEKSRFIHFSKSTDGGQTFSAPQIISNTQGFSDYPSIATDGSNIFVTWSWAKNLFDDPWKIYFSKSTIAESLTNNNSEEILEDNDTDSVLPQPDKSPSIESDINNSEDVPSVKNIQWLDENYADYSVGGIGIIKLVYPTLNVNKTLIDIPVIHVWSDTDPKGIPVDMIETGADTGIFYADISFTETKSSHLSLQVSKGDTITALYQDSAIMTSEHNISSIRVEESVPTPKNQMENGILLDQVKCKEGLELIIKLSDSSPACVKPETKQKLIERGWAR